MSIRLKVILPYILLTVVVAVIGVYVVTRLVSGTLRDRLTNQLLEAGRVVSDSFTRQEVSHVETARSVAFTAGLADALIREDGDTAAALVTPLFSRAAAPSARSGSGQPNSAPRCCRST